MLTAKQVTARFVVAVASAGGTRAFARKHRMSVALVSDVATGKRGVGPKVAQALGLRKVVGWEER